VLTRWSEKEKASLRQKKRETSMEEILVSARKNAAHVYLKKDASRADEKEGRAEGVKAEKISISPDEKAATTLATGEKKKRGGVLDCGLGNKLRKWEEKKIALVELK